MSAASSTPQTCAAQPRQICTRVHRTTAAEVFEPRFTFHGFQFVEVSGVFAESAIEEVTGIVLASALPRIGEFVCDHALLNQLQSNIGWSQRGNFARRADGLPPARRTSRLDGRRAGFRTQRGVQSRRRRIFRKWLVDLTDAQSADGIVPPLAPVPPALDALRRDGGPAWADAIVICPWTIYRCCGDRAHARAPLRARCRRSSTTSNRVTRR